jgi:hypothetical protein
MLERYKLRIRLVGFEFQLRLNQKELISRALKHSSLIICKRSVMGKGLGCQRRNRFVPILTEFALKMTQSISI